VQALEPLLQEQEKILWARHDTIVKALANSGFWSGKEFAFSSFAPFRFPFS